jgi:hypothetical protein
MPCGGAPSQLEPCHKPRHHADMRIKMIIEQFRGTSTYEAYRGWFPPCPWSTPGTPEKTAPLTKTSRGDQYQGPRAKGRLRKKNKKATHIRTYLFLSFFVRVSRLILKKQIVVFLGSPCRETANNAIKKIEGNVCSQLFRPKALPEAFDMDSPLLRNIPC